MSLVGRQWGDTGRGQGDGKKRIYRNEMEQFKSNIVSRLKIEENQTWTVFFPSTGGFK